MKALIKRTELTNIAQEPSLKNKKSNSAGRTPCIRKKKKNQSEARDFFKKVCQKRIVTTVFIDVFFAGFH
jgi:hypothetical protein